MNTENNRIIAEFMGYEILDKYCDTCPKNVEVDSLPMLEFMFNSWDELMPVVEKIEKTHCVDIFGKAVSIHEKYDGEMIVDQPSRNSSTKIDAVYKACLEFIKWYNK